MDTTSTGASPAAGTLEHPLDLLIVGSGIAGIDLAHHVSEAFPQWQWEIHDVQSDVGGTWHTFRYPGIRSDSDMATFGFPFRPWPHSTTLGQGPEIKEYIRDTARECGALDRLHLRSWIGEAEWHSEHGLYEVTAFSTDENAPGGQSERTIWARRLHFGAGYFDHDNGFRPTFPGEEKFRGTVIHPQQWPEDLDCRGKNVVVIGSGATAVTLVPALEQLGANVTMLQRTPTYIGPLPEADMISAIWKRLLPGELAHKVARFNHGARDMAQYVIAQRTPWLFKTALRLMQRRYLPASVLDEHFSPDYRPWDQRVCKAPNGDIFTSIKNGAQVVTDHIDTFTENGIRVRSGEEIPADIIVSATGLALQFFGNCQFSIDGQRIDGTALTSYRGVMLGGVPNFSFTIGYVNASWTLRADMVSKYMVKLWKRGHSQYAPITPRTSGTRPLLELDAGYVKRGAHLLPRQGDSNPWRYVQNYLVEIPSFTFGDQERNMVFDGAVRDHLATGALHTDNDTAAPAEALAKGA